MNVRWTASAQRHLRAIHSYIAQDSPEHAKRMVDRLTRRSIQIGVFPFSGRVACGYESNEIREVFEGPYRIIYFIGENQIDILAVVHGARNWRPE